MIQSLALPPEAFSNPGVSLLPHCYHLPPAPPVTRIHWPLSHYLASLSETFSTSQSEGQIWESPGSKWQPLRSSGKCGWEGLSRSMIWFLLVFLASSLSAPAALELSLALCTAMLSPLPPGLTLTCAAFAFTWLIPPCPSGLSLCTASSKQPSRTLQTRLGASACVSFAREKHQTYSTMISCWFVCLLTESSEVPDARGP